MNRPLHHAAEIRALLALVPDLSEGLRHTLIWLCLLSSSDRVAWVNRTVLSSCLGVHPTTVKGRLRELRDRGLLGEPVLRRSAGGYREYGHPILWPEDAPGLSQVDPSWMHVRLVRPTAAP